MQLDVIVPTYNRHSLLERALESLLAAELPTGLTVTVTVVDNNSRDNTSAVVNAFKPRFEGRLNYLFEPNPGKSHALNTGIAATSGDLVGMIDDDEQIDRSWFVRVNEVFANDNFIAPTCATLRRCRQSG
jgi:glycosyltransferase involved in cell wall biosynthesis